MSFAYLPTIPNFPGVLSHQAIVRNQVSTLGALDYWETANGGLPNNLICDTIKTTGQIQCGTTLNATEVNAALGFFPDLSGVNTINGVAYPPTDNAISLNIATNFASTPIPATQSVAVASYTLPTPLPANTNYLISVPYEIGVATQSPAAAAFNVNLWAGNPTGQAVGTTITSLNTGVQLAWTGTLSGVINTGVNPLAAISLFVINADPVNTITLAGTGATQTLYCVPV